MSGSVSRLIAIAALVAFLATNSYGISHMRQPLSDCTCEQNPSNHDVEESEALESEAHSDCEHCHATQVQSGPHSNEPSSVEQLSASHSPTCPCHGIGFPCPSCPCPGGCAFCSVAKVPCVPPVALLMDATPTKEDNFIEVAQSYTSPFTGTLTRPPKV
jgi:hypothetical protein